MERAGDLLADRAAAAHHEVIRPTRPGRWVAGERATVAERYVHVADHPVFGHVTEPNHGAGDYGLAYAEHIAGVDPLTAVAVAHVLYHAARVARADRAGYAIKNTHPYLVLARTYLREDPA